MTAFPLKIVTPHGIIYDGPAEALTVRTVTGDMGILAGHISCVAPLTSGSVVVTAGGVKRRGECTAGLVSVREGLVDLLATAFAWEQP